MLTEAMQKAYEQTIRENHMSAFDNLPAEVRTFLHHNEHPMLADDILFRHQFYFDNDAEKTLAFLKEEMA